MTPDDKAQSRIQRASEIYDEILVQLRELKDMGGFNLNVKLTDKYLEMNMEPQTSAEHPEGDGGDSKYYSECSNSNCYKLLSECKKSHIKISDVLKGIDNHEKEHKQLCEEVHDEFNCCSDEFKTVIRKLGDGK